MTKDKDENYLTTSEAAKFTTLSRRTLERLRVQGTGPIFYKLGQGKRTRVRYRQVDLLAWIGPGHTGTCEYPDRRLKRSEITMGKFGTEKDNKQMKARTIFLTTGEATECVGLSPQTLKKLRSRKQEK